MHCQSRPPALHLAGAAGSQPWGRCHVFLVRPRCRAIDAMQSLQRRASGGPTLVLHTAHPCHAHGHGSGGLKTSPKQLQGEARLSATGVRSREPRRRGRRREGGGAPAPPLPSRVPEEMSTNLQDDCE